MRVNVPHNALETRRNKTMVFRPEGRVFVPADSSLIYVTIVVVVVAVDLGWIPVFVSCSVHTYIRRDTTLALLDVG